MRPVIAWGSTPGEGGRCLRPGDGDAGDAAGQWRVFFSMSRDGLLPKWAAAIHPEFRTPWISNIVVGIIVAFLAGCAAHRPAGGAGEYGHAAGLHHRLRRGLDSAAAASRSSRPFKTPLVPLVPICGIVTALYLIWTLPALTKEVVVAGCLSDC